MTVSDPPRITTTPMEVLKLFLRGVDTVDIADQYGIREHEAYRLLRFALEAKRIGNATDRDTVPAEHEPPVEGH